MRIHRPNVKTLALGALLILGGTSVGRAIQIYGTDPSVQTQYDRFNQGTFPAAPVANPSFVGSSYDLSGVGWDDSLQTQGVTMISSQYFVFANHYPLANSGGVVTVDFANTSGAVKSYTVDPAGYHTLTFTDGASGIQTSDLRIGRLSAPIPASDHVDALPVLYLGATQVSTVGGSTTYTGFSLYNNLPLLVYGRGADTAHSPRMGQNTLKDFTEYNFTADTDPPTNIGPEYDQQQQTGQAGLEVGDSGSPTFGVKNGVFGLLGTHSGTETDSDNGLPIGLDAFVGYTSYVAQIDAILAADGQSLTLVPEPSSFAASLFIVGLAGAGVLTARRRRALSQ